MRLIKSLFLLSILLATSIINVKGDLKFDAQGNIIDDGLNLDNDLPKDSKKAKPLVGAKSNRLLPQSERVISNSAAKGIMNRNNYIFYNNDI